MPWSPIQQPNMIQSLILVTTANTNNSFRQRDTRPIGTSLYQETEDIYLVATDTGNRPATSQLTFLRPGFLST